MGEMMSHAVAEESARARLEEIRPYLPIRVGASVGRIYRTLRSAQIDGILELFEGMFIRLNSMANASYLASETTEPRVDAYLREVGPSPSFGKHVEMLRLLRQTEAHGPLASALNLISRESLPSDVCYFTEVVRVLKAAVHEYGVPGPRLKKYCDDNRRPPTQVKRSTLSEFADVVVQTRNQKGHKASKEATAEEVQWWRADNHFEDIVSVRLLASIEALLAWPPMTSVVTRYERVTALATGAQQPDGTFRTPVSRAERSDSILPLGPAFMVSECSTEEGQDYWADGYDLRSNSLLVEPIGLCGAVNVPTPKVGKAEIRAQYRVAYFERLVNDGIVDPAERAELNRLAKEYKVDASQSALEDSVVRRLEALAGKCAALKLRAVGYDELRRRATPVGPGDPHVVSPQSLLADLDGMADWLGLEPQDRERLLSVASCLTEVRRAYLKSEFARCSFLARTDMVAQTGLAQTTLDTLLNDLVDEGVIEPVGGALGREMGYYKSVDIVSAEVFRAAVARYQELGTPPSEEVATLLRACASLLDFGSAKTPHRHMVQLLSGAQDTGTPAGLTVGICVNGAPVWLRADTKKGICEEFWNAAADLPGVRDQLPFPKTGSQYLVNVVAKHRKFPFVSPYQVGDAHFETNYPDDKVVELLTALAEAAGIAAPRPGDTA